MVRGCVALLDNATRAALGTASINRNSETRHRIRLTFRRRPEPPPARPTRPLCLPTRTVARSDAAPQNRNGSGSASLVWCCSPRPCPAVYPPPESPRSAPPAGFALDPPTAICRRRPPLTSLDRHFLFFTTRTGDATDVIYVVVIFCVHVADRISVAAAVDGPRLLPINAPMLMEREQFRSDLEGGAT